MARIATMETGDSLFFDHRDPTVVNDPTSRTEKGVSTPELMGVDTDLRTQSGGVKRRVVRYQREGGSGSR